ncbi:hypothetical protein I3842_07G043600 [Carya illinoinensis]|uniref:Rhamnogalacturonan endolyase n=1 Tax=Carya illinoinensis TaxID=32201 RepID=A0A922JCI3_CARIL|nr:hypothetical protein I3842_07G043600 [Carya illinoinensis]
MKKANWNRQLSWVSLVVCIGVIISLVFLLADRSGKTGEIRRVLLNRGPESYDVKLHTDDPHQVVVDNGIVRVSFSRPDGHVLGINYNNGLDNLLEEHNGKADRGYWDVVWNDQPGGRDTGIFERVTGTNLTVIAQNAEQVELSFSRTWDVSKRGESVPLNIDKRYILRRGNSGFYSYAIFERVKGWPAVDISQIRIVYKLQEKIFHYMAISDDIQRSMPTYQDRENGQVLAYQEAVQLTNQVGPKFRGQVDDKYQYSVENKDNKVHGWISSSPSVGLWVITPSNEFRTAGPMKQDLTSHVGPFALSMFVSNHYAGKDVEMKFEEGEPWKKVFGPIFVYVNSLSNGENASKLWKNAKEQMSIEEESWPYNFTKSEDFPFADQRGTVTGQLMVYDPYINKELMGGKSAYVGLAAPGEVGSWQKESKGYQFWTQADEQGRFVIKNVRPGDYNLYAWVPGFVGDYKNSSTISIKPGSEIDLNVLVYEPPRKGPTLWEIGIPDRTAGEFYIPDPNPALRVPLYNINNSNPEKYRQYGLWDRYTDLYPDQDLIYNISTSNYRTDWFFAHVTRRVNGRTYEGTIWQIVFELQTVLKDNSNYTLQMALASAEAATLQVRFNNPRARFAHFSTGVIGEDNAIARHGVHGLYWFYTIDVPSDLLQVGENTIYLRQAKSGSPFQGVMYDYLRLEGPPQE